MEPGRPQIRRVLLVDDEASILLALRRLLGRRKIEVLAAPAAQAALQILETSPCEAVIADYRMPGHDGLAFLAQVARRLPATRRILMSGYRVPNVEQHLAAGTVHHYVQKPIDMQELLGLLGIRISFGDDR